MLKTQKNYENFKKKLKKGIAFLGLYVIILAGVFLGMGILCPCAKISTYLHKLVITRCCCRGTE